MPVNAALLAARFLLAALFVPAGYATLGDIAGSAGYFADLGFPAADLVAWAVGFFELVAGILVLIGYQTRIAAVLFALFCVSAGIIGHYGQGGEDPMLAFMHSQAMMKDIAIAGGFLALAVSGPGAWSLDARFG